MDELFVTTASCHASEDPDKVDEFPEGGDLFVAVFFLSRKTASSSCGNLTKTSTLALE
jgi:hypothetical protein